LLLKHEFNGAVSLTCRPPPPAAPPRRPLPPLSSPPPPRGRQRRRTCRTWRYRGAVPGEPSAAAADLRARRGRRREVGEGCYGGQGHGSKSGEATGGSPLLHRALGREDVVESSGNSRLLWDNGRLEQRAPSDGDLTHQMGRHTKVSEMIDNLINNYYCISLNSICSYRTTVVAKSHEFWIHIWLQLQTFTSCMNLR
jgi:hypothetical protein